MKWSDHNNSNHYHYGNDDNHHQAVIIGWKRKNLDDIKIISHRWILWMPWWFIWIILMKIKFFFFIEYHICHLRIFYIPSIMEFTSQPSPINQHYIAMYVCINAESMNEICFWDAKTGIKILLFWWFIIITQMKKRNSIIIIIIIKIVIIINTIEMAIIIIK